MLPQSSQSSHPSAQLATVQTAPRREQWGVINKYKALQFERMKQQELVLDRHKKEQFRRALDNQLNTRNSVEQRQKEQDRAYYQQLAEKGQQQRVKEEDQKRQRFLHRKHVDEQNINKLQGKSRIRDGDSGYHLQIGQKSEKDHVVKANMFRKDMMDTLDVQLRQKSQQQKLNKIRNQQLQEVHKKVQGNSFLPSTRKQYGQNQRIYDYYDKLQKERLQKEQDLEHKFVDKARERNAIVEAQKERQEIDKRQYNKEVVKETLGQQVIDIQRKRVLEHTTNPEELSFKFISGIFESKYPGYDKAKYKQDLQRQAEEMKLRKQRENHMSQEQYKFNMNQLSKAVLGDFAQNNYLDRSLGAIGEKYQIDRLDEEVKDEDVDVIKSRLRHLRQRGNLSTIM